MAATELDDQYKNAMDDETFLRAMARMSACSLEACERFEKIADKLETANKLAGIVHDATVPFDQTAASILRALEKVKRDTLEKCEEAVVMEAYCVDTNARIADVYKILARLLAIKEGRVWTKSASTR